MMHHQDVEDYLRNEEARDDARKALRAVLQEMPMEFSSNPALSTHPQQTRDAFSVRRQANVRKVHEALWVLQEYLND